MILLGPAAEEPVAGARQPPDRRSARGGLRAVPARPTAREQLDQPLMRDVAGRGEHDPRAGVRPAVPVPERSGRHLRDHVRAADHRSAERMLAEHRLGREVVDEVLRVVVDHRDLLEHDLPLGVDVVERRREDHVGHRVERVVQVAVGHACVEDGRLARGGRVELAAHGVEELREALRAVPRRPLEEQVLDEVRDAGAERGSSREPVPIQSPSATERTPRKWSVTTRSPPGSIVTSGLRTRSILASRFASLECGTCVTAWKGVKSAPSVRLTS